MLFWPKRARYALELMLLNVLGPISAIWERLVEAFKPKLEKLVEVFKPKELQKYLLLPCQSCFFFAATVMKFIVLDHQVTSGAFPLLTFSMRILIPYSSATMWTHVDPMWTQCGPCLTYSSEAYVDQCGPDVDSM